MSILFIPWRGSNPHLKYTPDATTATSTNNDRGANSSKCRTTVTLIACFFELIFFGGTIFGWASLAFVFKEDQLFSLSCPDLNILANGSSSPNLTSANKMHNYTLYNECVSQEESLSLVFTIGLVFFGLSSFPVGFLFDKFGLRITRIFAANIGCCGYLLLAFAKKETSWFLVPGMACVGTSCVTMILTNSYIGRMAGKKSSTIITLYAGSINSSVVVFLVVKLLNDHGINRQYSLAVLAGLWIPSLLITVLLLPADKSMLCCWAKPNKAGPENALSETNDKPKDGKEQDTHEYYNSVDPHGKQIKTSEVDKNTNHTSRNLIIRYILRNRKVPGSVSNMLSLMYFMYIYWYCSLHVRIQLFISQFNIWVSSLVHHDLVQVSHFTNILGYAMMCSVIISPLGGILIDSQRHLLKDMADGQGCKSIVALPSLIVTGISSVLVSCLIYSKNTYFVYAIVIFAEIYRSFFYATSLALLELSFPKEHYGRLFGLVRSISGVISFLQYPYVLFANSVKHGFKIVNIFLLITVLFSLMLPIYIVILYGQHRQRMAARSGSNIDGNPGASSQSTTEAERF